MFSAVFSTGGPAHGQVSADFPLIALSHYACTVRFCGHPCLRTERIKGAAVPHGQGSEEADDDGRGPLTRCLFHRNP